MGPFLAALLTLGPPPLPEDAPPPPRPPTSSTDAPRVPAPPDELEPIPFPLEQTGPKRTERLPPPRRSIVDLRDPFDRPPPSPEQVDRQRRTSALLLTPDLKDPFAGGSHPIRSQRLDVHIPNDIRDPFRDRPDDPGPPKCFRTLEDGTRVQVPGADAKPGTVCERSPVDLRNPFDHD